MADLSKYAHIPPGQSTAFKSMHTIEDTPNYVAATQSGPLTSQQNEAAAVSKRAQASAMQNMWEARGGNIVTPRDVSPEEATDYPAF